MPAKPIRAALAAASLLGAPAAVPAALAEEKIYASADPALLTELAKRYGFAELSQGTDGSPLIKASIDGVGYIVKFFCARKPAGNAPQTCNSIQFNLTVTKEIGIDRLNDFNTRNRWVRAATFDDGKVPRTSFTRFSMDAYFWGGVTLKNSAMYFETWKQMLPRIKQITG